MKKSKYVIVGCLVAALVIVLIPRSHDAQTFRAPKLESEKVEIAISGNEFMQCMNATNLTLSQTNLTRLQIVSDVLDDPYCCEKEAISEERHACLEENVTALMHMCKMLQKTHADKNSKCYGASASAMTFCLCPPVFSTAPGLSGDIHRDASCVRDLVSSIAVKYDSLTRCPGN